MIHIENRPPRLNPFAPVLQQLRQVLKQSGYNTAGIAPNFECLNPDPTSISTGSPLHTLLRLFHSQEPVDPTALRVALQPLTLEQVLETGFCRIDGDQVRSNVFLQPYNDLLFAIGSLSGAPSRRCPHGYRLEFPRTRPPNGSTTFTQRSRSRHRLRFSRRSSLAKL